MESKNSRYQSRILREMHQNTENPFNSPPSSTGSHGTVTMTSNISIGPEGESTRRFEDESLRLPTQPSQPMGSMAYNINTSVLGRTFPEWKGLNSDAPEQEPTEDIYNVTSDNVAYNSSTKENIPPTSSTLASPTDIKNAKSSKVRENISFLFFPLSFFSTCAEWISMFTSPPSLLKPLELFTPTSSGLLLLALVCSAGLGL